MSTCLKFSKFSIIHPFDEFDRNLLTPSKTKKKTKRMISKSLQSIAMGKGVRKGGGGGGLRV